MCRTASVVNRYTALFFLGLIAVSQTFALHADKNETVHITADKSTYNYKTGINVFEGHVKVDQGTTHLTADRLITKNNAEHKIKEAIAYGIHKKAHYWTLPKAEDPVLHGHGKIIKYYPVESNVTLEKDAFIKQGKNSFQGQIIHYNSLSQVITVPGKHKNRSILVYNPDTE